MSREEGRRDLLEAVSASLLEIERLQDLTEQLKHRSAQPEELEKFMRSILPTLDAFERVLSLARTYPKSEEIDNWLKAVESIYFRLLSMLENYGLYQLKCVGKKVDLNLHEVVEYRPSTEHPDETVIAERQKGYVFRGKLLRDAKVVVAYNERR
ncbi:Heat shock protein GrpE [Candidatus Sumerlaea chitinivorans]|uniref:Protein GrpE n=1 Tax=Sumerlaea chitinivorans TaxID=2250252 RepID=A0A2Z4Y579_SUMC1|nr:Heat shock protein GrpE [Candidatus Sumerlaea chitinivorans]